MIFVNSFHAFSHKITVSLISNRHKKIINGKRKKARIMGGTVKKAMIIEGRKKEPQARKRRLRREKR